MKDPFSLRQDIFITILNL